jgi:hypothetical protein
MIIIYMSYTFSTVGNEVRNYFKWFRIEVKNERNIVFFNKCRLTPALESFT